MIPIDAETFKSSTVQISQNCGVLCASRRWTLPVLIFAVAADAVQPAGVHPVGGTR